MGRVSPNVFPTPYLPLEGQRYESQIHPGGSSGSGCQDSDPTFMGHDSGRNSQVSQEHLTSPLISSVTRTPSFSPGQSRGNLPTHSGRRLTGVGSVSVLSLIIGSERVQRGGFRNEVDPETSFIVCVDHLCFEGTSVQSTARTHGPR